MSGHQGERSWCTGGNEKAFVARGCVRVRGALKKNEDMKEERGASAVGEARSSHSESFIVSFHASSTDCNSPPGHSKVK